MPTDFQVGAAVATILHSIAHSFGASSPGTPPWRAARQSLAGLERLLDELAMQSEALERRAAVPPVVDQVDAEPPPPRPVRPRPAAKPAPEPAPSAPPS